MEEILEQIEEDIQEIWVGNMEKEVVEDQYRQAQAQIIGDHSDKLINMEIQMGTMVFEAQVRKEVQAS